MTRRLGCPECSSSRGVLHTRWCSYRNRPGNTDGYVSAAEARPLEEFPVTTAAADAVVNMLDGGLVPKGEEPAPLRRIELAVIWLGEAERELDEAIQDGITAGVRSHEIAEAMGIASSTLRMRLKKMRDRRLSV